MARESIQKKLQRVRPPRVQITYDVEIGDAIELKELPFVLGVMGDFTGQPTEPLPRLKDRRFVEVTPDNFDSVIESMRPHLAFSVENKLSEESDAPQLKVDLNFKSLKISSQNRLLARFARFANYWICGPSSTICEGRCRQTKSSISFYWTPYPTRKNCRSFVLNSAWHRREMPNE